MDSRKTPVGDQTRLVDGIHGQGLAGGLSEPLKACLDETL